MGLKNSECRGHLPIAHLLEPVLFFPRQVPMAEEGWARILSLFLQHALAWRARYIVRISGYVERFSTAVNRCEKSRKDKQQDCNRVHMTQCALFQELQFQKGTSIGLCDKLCPLYTFGRRSIVTAIENEIRINEMNILRAQEEEGNESRCQM